MRVLAIGGSGFIGRRVVSLLIDRGHEVHVLHRGTGGAVPEGAQDLRGDRDHLEACSVRLERLAPDVIVDLVLHTERQAHEMVRFFRGKAGRVVAVSSADVYRNHDGLRARARRRPTRYRSPRARRFARPVSRTEASSSRSRTRTTTTRSSSSRSC